MSDIPADLKYAPSHEWVRDHGDGTVTVGITDHAQAALGDLVFVELPEIGRRCAAREACAVVESVKAASDIYAPVGGEIIAINEKLNEAPETVNHDPYGAGWLLRLRLDTPAELATLLDAAAYAHTLSDD